MNFKRFAKQATVVTLSTDILLGVGESLTYAKEKDSRDHNESYGISHMTRSDMYKMIEQQNDPRYTVPKFDESKIENISSAKGYDELGNLIDLDVWDTWPLQNADGTVANYNGYQIVFGLAGDPDRGWDTFVYMFYKKIGDTGIDSWKNAGRVFKDSDKFKSDDPVLRNQAEEWSGSATFTEDGKVRLFYTNRHGWDPAHNFFGKQTLTTAQVNVSEQG